MRRFLFVFGILFVSSFFAFAQNPDDDFEAFMRRQHSIAEEKANAPAVPVVSTESSETAESTAVVEDSLTEQQRASQKIGDMALIEHLIEKDLEGNWDEIVELAENLTEDERWEIYEKCEKSGGKYFALNLLLGFGIGSFAQGDKENGLRQLCFTCAGISLICAGMNVPSMSMVFVPIGAGFCIGATVLGCIAPWTFAANRNESLQECLGLSVESFAFAPVIDVDGKTFGLVAKINF